ncbi:hypothetical protein RchiOBHm_Chr1g0342881 [Rosa chinensis]|uniref:Uncharacterized protein n=1 Tax=Rosa chinensis TaxID=74649 RepID=A0A2P6SE43_ROSCH|nr:hypothetical protein RchiOBHm_Chr1g0342881 [Rosa chinensis]
MVVNVLVDMGSVGRQVLVKIMRERKFLRGSIQTVLLLNRQHGPARLCANYDYQVSSLRRLASGVQEEAQQCRRRKRDEEDNPWDLKEELQSVKVTMISVDGSKRMQKDIAINQQRISTHL